MRKIAALALLMAMLPQIAGCAVAQASGYAGYASPRDTLQTYFGSAMKADYPTTYRAYYAHYRDLVARDEFVSHRKQASLLTAYRIDALSQSGESAVATATLTFAPRGGETKPRVTVVREDLVRESGSWKIRVW